MEYEEIEFDVVFVGGGPAGLAGAIRLKQMADEAGRELEICVIEKGAEIGAHGISGAVLNPVALGELIPGYREKGCPIETDVTKDAFLYLTENKAIKAPVTPKHMRNHGMHIISLSRFSRWLGEIAEEMEIHIFPGFAATRVLFGEDEKTVTGVRTGDKGRGADGAPRSNFEPGYDIRAKITVFAEGARGSLMKSVEQRLGLFKKRQPQVFEIGVKEVIQLPGEGSGFAAQKCNDLHFMGYPLGLGVPGGGFIYAMAENRVAIGYLVSLCWENPRLDPYNEFLRFKQHPFVAKLIKGGKVLEQGARTVVTSGYYSLPELAVDGAMFTGGAAGIHNTPALKGIHLAMKSGMLAAETCFEAVSADAFDRGVLKSYPEKLEQSYIKTEMFEGRNTAQGLAKTGMPKLFHLGAQYVSGGRGIIDPMPLGPDAETLRPAAETPDLPAINPRSLDGELLVDKLTGVYLARTMHREDEPGHLIISNPAVCAKICYPKYGAPCVNFCPGAVYELEKPEDGGDIRIKLNPSNCLHCKTCDIKDPYGNILWTCPEGGEGPNYVMA
ncbi:MAG: protein EtfO [Desulfobacterales bacterium]|nr:MAG: protein EtfO [Desulfobacterales bacterium]